MSVKSLFFKASSCALTVAVSGVLALGVAGHSPTVQAQEERQYEHAQARQRHAVGARCGGLLEPVQKQLEDEQWQQAERALRAALNSHCQTSYEKSQVWNFLGYVYYSLDRVDDAINAYRNVINEEETDERMRVSTRYTVAQLYFMNEDYQRAVAELERWREEATIVGNDGLVLLAQGYYQLDRGDDALRIIEGVIRDAESKGETPREHWWGLQRAVYYDRGDYRRVVQIMEEMLKHYPKVSYWRQLGGMYGELNRSMDQLVAQDVVHLMGGLDSESQLMALAYMYLGADAPYNAARIIEKGMEAGTINDSARNLEVLGSAWQQAQDVRRALPVLERAARGSDSGEIYSRLAGVYLDNDRPEDAVRAARNALNRGGLRRTDLANMVLGSSLLELHCYDDAIRAFRSALNDERSERYARQWIEYAENEGDRRRRLIEAGSDISGCQRV